LKKILHCLIIILLCAAGFTTAEVAEELIEPGNIVHITVLGYPELSKAVLVRQDGSTDYPLLADVPIDGMTIHQLQDVLYPIVARFVERPKLFINIADQTQIKVTIEGQVMKAGTYIIEGSSSLQGALAFAGGATSMADLRNVSIVRRDHAKELNVDLHHYFLNRESVTLPEIRDGDIIFVPTISSKTTVRVLGAVRNPGTYVPVKDEDIADLISMAGGPLTNGNMNHVVHIKIVDGKSKTDIIELRNLLNEGHPDLIPLVSPGDVIVVAEYNPWQQPSWWIRTLLNVTMILSSLVILTTLR